MRGFLIGAVAFAAVLTSAVPVSATGSAYMQALYFPDTTLAQLDVSSIPTTVSAPLDPSNVTDAASTSLISTDIPEAVAAQAVTLESPGSRYPGEAVTIRGNASLSRIVVQILRPNLTVLWTDVMPQDRFTAGVPLTLPADAPNGTYTILAGSGTHRAEAVFQVVERSVGQEEQEGEEPEESAPAPETGEPAPTASLHQLPDGTAVLSFNPEKPDASGLAQAVIPAEALEQAKALNARSIRLEPIMPEGATGIEALLPAQVLASWPADTRVELHTAFAKVRIPAGELTGSTPEETSKFSLSKISLSVNRLSNAPQAITTSSQLEAVRNKPIVDILLKRDGQPVHAISARNGITVELPYSPTQAERTHPEALVVWSLMQEKDMVKPVIDSRYVSKTGSIIFRTSSFGTFAAAYTLRLYADMENAHWAKSPVAALAARGVIQGVSEREFAPDRPVTRADYVLLLMRAFEPAAGEQPDKTFRDVPAEAYYYEAVAAAQSLGIAEGDGQNFHPEATVTRQDMMVLADRVIRAAGVRPASSPTTLNSFSDHTQVAPYAQESIGRLTELGVVQGTGGQLEPLRPTTRAEAAALIDRLLTRLQPES